MAGLAEFLTVLIPSAVLGLVWLLLFCFCRTKKHTIYKPKVLYTEIVEQNENARTRFDPIDGLHGLDDSENEQSDDQKDDVQNSASSGLQDEEGLTHDTDVVEIDEIAELPPVHKPLTEKKCGWISELWNIDERDFLDHAGLDALIHLRVIKMAFWIFVISGIYNVIVLIPVYATGELGVSDGLTYISLGNVAQESDRLWATWVSVVLTTICALFFLFKNYKELYVYAKEYGERNRVENYTIMLSRLPLKFRSAGALREIHNEDPGKVHNAVIAKDLKDLLKLFNKKTKLEKKLRKVEEKMATGKTPTHRVKCRKVVSYGYYTAEIANLEEQIKEHTEKVHDSGTTGFVTFSAMEPLASEISKTHSYKNPCCKWTSGEYRVEKAPEPRDIIWENLAESIKKEKVHTCLTHFFMISLIVLYTIPVAFVSGLLNLENLYRLFPWLESIVESSEVVKGLLQGLLPTLALMIFMALLPIMIKKTHEMRYPKSTSHLELWCFRRYYFCLVYFVFFGVTVLGNLFSFLDNIDELSFSDVIDLLGVEIPALASFFMGYVALAGLTNNTAELFRLVPIIFSIIKKMSWDIDDLPYMEYRIQLPNDLLIFTIAFIYVTIAPLMHVWAIIYFAIGYVVWKYQFLYVYFPKYDIRGRYWPDVVNRVIAVLVLYQVVTLFMVLILKGWVQVGLIVPFIVLTFFVQYYLHTKYRRVFVSLSRSQSKIVDQQRGEVQFDEESYVAPVLKHELVRPEQRSRVSKMNSGSTSRSSEADKDDGSEEPEPVSV